MSCLQWKLIMGKCVTSGWPYYRTNRRWKCIKSKQRLETNRSLWAMCQLWVGCIECERTSVELLQEPKSECEQRNGEKQACHKWSEMKCNGGKANEKVCKMARHRGEVREYFVCVHCASRACTHAYVHFSYSSNQHYSKQLSNLHHLHKYNEYTNEWMREWMNQRYILKRSKFAFCITY